MTAIIDLTPIHFSKNRICFCSSVFCESNYNVLNVLWLCLGFQSTLVLVMVIGYLLDRLKTGKVKSIYKKRQFICKCTFFFKLILNYSKKYAEIVGQSYYHTYECIYQKILDFLVLAHCAIYILWRLDFPFKFMSLKWHARGKITPTSHNSYLSHICFQCSPLRLNETTDCIHLHAEESLSYLYTIFVRLLILATFWTCSVKTEQVCSVLLEICQNEN